VNVIDKETISQHTTCAIHRRNTNWGRDHKARHEKHHTNKTRSQLANAHHGDPNSFLDWIRIDLDDVFVKPHSLLIIHLVFPFCISLLAILSTLSHKHTPRQNKNTIFSSSSACGLSLAFFFSPFFFSSCGTNWFVFPLALHVCCCLFLLAPLCLFAFAGF